MSTAARPVVFDLVGVLAEPTWRSLHPDPGNAPWTELKTGRLEESEFWDESVATTYRRALRLRPDRLHLLAELDRRGHPIFIATNFFAGWTEGLREQLRRRELDPTWLISSELGCAKPDAAFFAALREQVPEGTPFLDDQAPNVAAAREAGLAAFHACPGLMNEELLEGWA
ncbi:MAG: HAD family hydrolase [Acidobacteriota bacterium]